MCTHFRLFKYTIYLDILNVSSSYRTYFRLGYTSPTDPYIFPIIRIAHSIGEFFVIRVFNKIIFHTSKQ